MDIFKAKVALERISKFLNEPELTSHLLKEDMSNTKMVRDCHIMCNQTSSETLNEVIPLSFEHADFCHFQKNSGSSATNATFLEDIDQNSSEPLLLSSNDRINAGFLLRDLNVTFPLKRLSVVIGPTGSGKSSLLLALLGGKFLSTNAL